MAVHPVIIEFLARGIPDVSRALRGVEAAAAAAERSQTRTSQREGQSRKKAVDEEVRMKIRAMQQADRWQRQAHERAVRETERAARQRTRAEERAEREMVRNAERAGAERIRIARQVDREFAQMQARRERENRRIVAEAARIEAREGRLAARAANDNARARDRFVGGITGAAGRGIAAGVGRVTGLAAQTAGMVGQLGGGFSIADSVQRSVGLKGKLADIASRDVDFSAEGVAAGKDKRKSTASLEASVRAVSSEFGIEADKGADALDKFASKTGELQKGLDMLRGLGELSRAGAGDLDDLADAAGDIFNADKTQSAEQVLQKLRQFAIQGQKGAVEMKDLASQMAKIGAAAGRFEGGADRNLLTMGALAQMARGGGGASSAPEATTAVASLSNQFYKNARLDKMAALGVDPKTAEGYNRPIEEVIFELMLGAEKKSRAGGKGLHDFDKLMGTAFADAQARKATGGLEKAFKAAGGGEKGIAAARAELAKYGAGGRDLKAEFASKASSRMQEDDAKLARIREDFDKAVSGRVLPALMKLIPEFERMVPTFVDLNAKAMPAIVNLIKTFADFAEKNKGIIESIAAHPIGAIMAMEVTKSIAAASLGDVVKRLLASAFPGGGGGAVPPGGGAGGGPSPMLAPAAAALATYAIVKPAVDAGLAGQVSGQYKAGALESDMAQGGAARAKAMADYRKMQDEYGGVKGIAKIAGNALTMGNDVVYSAITGEKNTSAENIKKAMEAREIIDSEGIKRAIADAVREGAKQGAREGAGGAPPPSNDGANGAGRSQSFLERKQ